ncbi:MAG: hypothetical protein AAB667_00860 [Patescibacteria group bacterium]
MIAKMAKWVKSYAYELFMVASVAMIAVISYNLGGMQAVQKSPLKVTQDASIFNAVSGVQETEGDKTVVQKAPQPKDPRVVVSKNSSSKKYHHIWCAGAKQINPENQIWFDTAQAAETAGYTLAGNCQ